jgi:hypothetical protein
LRGRKQLAADTCATDGQLNPRLVQSLQQSLAVEGYELSEDVVRAAGERLARRTGADER